MIAADAVTEGAVKHALLIVALLGGATFNSADTGFNQTPAWQPFGPPGCVAFKNCSPFDRDLLPPALLRWYRPPSTTPTRPAATP